MFLKWSIVKSTPEPKQQRKAYHLNDTWLLCDFKILFVRNTVIRFYQQITSVSQKTTSFFCHKTYKDQLTKEYISNKFDSNHPRQNSRTSCIVFIENRFSLEVLYRLHNSMTYFNKCFKIEIMLRQVTMSSSSSNVSSIFITAKFIYPFHNTT